MATLGKSSTTIWNMFYCIIYMQYYSVIVWQNIRYFNIFYHVSSISVAKFREELLSWTCFFGSAFGLQHLQPSQNPTSLAPAQEHSVPENVAVGTHNWHGKHQGTASILQNREAAAVSRAAKWSGKSIAEEWSNFANLCNILSVSSRLPAPAKASKRATSRVPSSLAEL